VRDPGGRLAVGGILEVVEDGKTGLLVEPGRPERWPPRSARLLEDPARGRAMGRAAGSASRRSQLDQRRRANPGGLRRRDRRLSRGRGLAVVSAVSLSTSAGSSSISTVRLERQRLNPGAGETLAALAPERRALAFVSNNSRATATTWRAAAPPRRRSPSTS